jgi:cytochrome c oxidase subunit 1
MPRRVYTYAPGRGWEFWNLVASAGLLFQLPATLIFVWNVVYSAIKGKIAGDDPWDAWTLEWSTSSPPPEYNFEITPEVHSSRPLWDLKNPNDPDWRFE